jgi:hypothetical protein
VEGLAQLECADHHAGRVGGCCKIPHMACHGGVGSKWQELVVSSAALSRAAEGALACKLTI